MFKIIKRLTERIPAPLRKLTVFIVGWLIIALGIALLALPGPGWATIFLGFAILATEFTSARAVRDWLVGKIKLFVKWVTSRIRSWRQE